MRVLPLGLGVADGAAAADAAQGHGKGVREVERQDWPVRARRDPLVGVPEMSVELPELPKTHVRIYTKNFSIKGAFTTVSRPHRFLSKRLSAYVKNIGIHGTGLTTVNAPLRSLVCAPCPAP